MTKMTNKRQFKTIDEYIEIFPQNVQSILEKVRQIILKTAPEAEETITYGIPSFKLKGRSLVYFAAWKRHISLYPVPLGDEAFQKELSPNVGGKGTVRFRLDKPFPYDLVEKIVKFLLKEYIE
jgi:uncharacterized protein YdhG (YjbR/CyaY superfamily)